MTHKIPHDFDIVFLIILAAKMKLYTWFLKKKKKRGKTPLVIVSNKAVEDKTDS